MHNSNDIKKIVDIQDTNITVLTNCLKVKFLKGPFYNFITAKLSYTPNNHAICSMKNEIFSIILIINFDATTY